MVRTVHGRINSKQAPKKPSRRKKSRSLLFNIALGVGMTASALIGASVVSVATSVKPADVRFEVAITKPVQPAVSPALQREVDVSRFSRLSGGTVADAKARRLAGAELAALQARRPAQASVKQALASELAKAARHAETEQKFLAMAQKRPDQALIVAALRPAMEELVVVAPRGNAALPDLIQDAAPATSVAELKDMKPVEMAAVEQVSTGPAGQEVAVVEEVVPAPAAPAYALPKAGPLPVIRPSTAVTSAEKPEKPNALAAIAAVAPQKPRETDEKPTALAFAKPDYPLREAPSAPAQPAPNWPGIGSKVAIYDITNAVVHMPDGTKLEAHSGIGSMRDNPKFTHVKMRGPTPPGTYKLSMRESLFHGVAAIRLTSVDGKHPQNRTGLLAHSFLLRVRGDSHGCVAFAQYDKFLKAFQKGEITHMVIVPKWDGKRPGRGTNDNFLAKLFGGSDA